MESVVDICDPVCSIVEAMRSPDALAQGLLDAWSEAGVSRPESLTSELLSIHYKPLERARILALTRVVESGETRPRLQYHFIRVYSDQESARRRLQSGAKHPYKSVGPPTFTIDPWQAAVWALPNGPCLRTARFGFSSRRYARFLCEHGLIDTKHTARIRKPMLLRYVPRRRVVFKYRKRKRNPRVYTKVYGPGSDEAAARCLGVIGSLAEDSEMFDVPRMLVHDQRRRAIVMSRVRGKRLTRSFGTDTAGDHLEQVGCALATLHRLPRRPGDCWTAMRESIALRATVADLAVAFPGWRTAMVTLSDALARLAPSVSAGRVALIHGNLFGDQVMVGRDRVGIVDWDDLCVGDPMYDMGRLIAHIVFVYGDDTADARDVSGRLLEAYTQAGGWVDHRSLNWNTSVALLIRAKISALRPLAPTCRADTERALRHAEAVASKPDTNDAISVA